MEHIASMCSEVLPVVGEGRVPGVEVGDGGLGGGRQAGGLRVHQSRS